MHLKIFIKISLLSVVLWILGCTKDTTDLEILENSNHQSMGVVENTLELNPKPLTSLTENDVLNIWVRADGAPGMYLNDSSEVVGFYINLEKAVMKEMGQKYTFHTYTDTSLAIQNIKIGTAHSALAVPDVPDYRLMTNISTTFETLEYVIFVQENSSLLIPDDKYNAILSLYGKKVGVQTRGHIYQLLRDHKEIELYEYPTTTIAMEALHKGEVDAVPEVKRIGEYYTRENSWNIRPVGKTIFSLDIGTGFSKTLELSVVYRYNKALQKLIDNGYVEKLYSEYFYN